MLHLASQSPRRRELLARLGLQFSVIDLDLPEQRAPGEAPEAYVCRVAGAKAHAGLERVRHDPGAVVVGADTEVVLDGEVFGKPLDRADAAAMLARLSGRTHEVLTAVVVAAAGGQRSVLARTEVQFGDLEDADIAHYLDSGEAMGKAGAYGIQGQAERFVLRISGSWSAVMGLPLHQTAVLLREAGMRVPGNAVATMVSASEPAPA
jgi:septum formation protein